MIVKKQHYVPQFYLTHFSSNSNNLYVYDKEIKKCFVAAIRDVANEKYFYDLSEEQEAKLGVRQFIENFFRPLETETGAILIDVLQRLLQNDFTLTASEINNLSQYLYYQYIRTKEYRAFFTNAFKTILKPLIDFHLRLKYGKEQESNYMFNIDESIAHAKYILNEKRAKECMSTFVDRYWILAENKTQTPFYASDHPFVKIAHKADSLLSHAGIKSEGIEIAFPISTNFIIVLLEKTFFKKYENYHGKKIVIDNEENINFYNWLQIKDSYRQIYCGSESFQLVKESLKLSPHFFDVDRQRLKLETILLSGNKMLMHNQLVYSNIYSKDVLGKSFF